jgi:hypothetical protein
MAHTPSEISNRQRLWHPRGMLCAVCGQPAHGFGWRELHRSSRPRPPCWFCSISCQSFWTQRSRGAARMVDLTEEECAAVTATIQRLAALMEEIGWTTRLAELTEAQVRTLIEEAVEGFREAMADIARANTPEVPF